MSESDADDEKSGLTRAELLKAVAVAAPGILLGRAAGASAAATTRPRRRLTGNGHGIDGMNVLVFLTDQQREVQHFPPGWTRRKMPGLTRLQEHGMHFVNAFTNACLCSPARSTFMSGYFQPSTA
jgi:choline-sulfatase